MAELTFPCEVLTETAQPTRKGKKRTFLKSEVSLDTFYTRLREKRNGLVFWRYSLFFRYVTPSREIHSFCCHKSKLLYN